MVKWWHWMRIIRTAAFFTVRRLVLEVRNVKMPTACGVSEHNAAEFKFHFVSQNEIVKYYKKCLLPHLIRETLSDDQRSSWNLKSRSVRFDFASQMECGGISFEFRPPFLFCCCSLFGGKRAFLTLTNNQCFRFVSSIVLATQVTKHGARS